MPTWSTTISACDGCCGELAAVDLSYTCTSTTDTGVCLEGWTPFTTEPAGTCTRYRTWTYEELQDKYDAYAPGEPWSCDFIGDCANGGNYTKYDQTVFAEVNYPDTSTSSAAMHRRLEGCGCGGSGAVCFDEDVTQAAYYPSFIPPGAPGYIFTPTVLKTENPYNQWTCGVGGNVSTKDDFVELKWTLSNADTFSAALARKPSPTVSDDCCAWATANTPCCLASMQTVSVEITATGLSPSTNYNARIQYLVTPDDPEEPGFTAVTTQAFTTDANGDWTGTVDMPEPAVGYPYCVNRVYYVP